MKPDNKKRRSKKRRPDGYYGKWERGQTVKAKELKSNIKKVRRRIDRYVKTHPQHSHLKTVILLGIMMKRYGFSLRRMVAELHYRGGSRKAAGLKHVPSKSWLHKWLRRLPMDMLDGLILFTAGRAAYGSFSVDSTHHRFNRHVLVDDPNGERRANMKNKGRRDGKNDAAKKRWVADTCKHHALVSPDGMVLASMVIDRNTADATMFEKLCAKMPEGSGPALGDSAYYSSTNCEAAIARGRDPYFEPKKSHAGKGTGNWAKMVRLWREHPGRFYRVYRARTTIEAAFSAIKGRFAYCVRSVTISMQERELTIVSICRNIGA